MNRVYKVIWNASQQVWMAAGELAKTQGKSKNAVSASPGTALRNIVAGSVLLIPSTLWAGSLPSGGEIRAGQGSINQSGNNMVIHQSSDRLAIDWQQFSIAEGSRVEFIQPGSDSAALNRVLGDQVSTIQGALKANGQVFLINPNGIIFGNGAQVDVGGLVASTLAISTEDFMAGNLKFEGASSNAIINRGNIRTAAGGHVAMIAAEIINTGNIEAFRGDVLMGAGSRVTLDLGGPVKIEVEEALLDTYIEQGGAIKADGGLIYLTAKAAGELASSVINHTGVTEARTLASGKNGEIVLIGDMDYGTTQVAGTLDASAPEDGDGGFIETSAAYIQVADETQVTTTSSTGNHGTWLIDPVDFTIAASGGDMTGATLSTNLASGNVTIQSTSGSSGTAGDVNVNDSVSWSANTLTLNAQNDININTEMNASGTAGLALEYGQAAVAAGNTSTYNVNAPVNLASTGSFSTKLGSDGTVVNYTIITSLGSAGSTTGTDLQGINGNLSGNYVLGADIDANATAGWNSGAGFDPIGDSNTQFSGTFDGLGHIISELTINRPGEDRVSLFGYTLGATIRNIGMLHGSISGDWYTGGLVGYNQNTAISNVYSTGGVSGGGSSVGGLVGYNNSSSINNAYATGNVVGTNQSVGGLVGYNDSSSINNAYATGSVKGDYFSGYIGGLVGNNTSSTINNTYATGNVEGRSSSVGGLVGGSFGLSTLTNAYWDTETTGRSTAVGFDASGLTANGLTTANALTQASYSGFDFANDWFMVEGSTRPMLRSEWSSSIKNTHQLQLMAMDLNADYSLGRDIDFGTTFTDASRADIWATSSSTGAGFDPVGGINNQFTGNFNGLGHTISDLVINRGTEEYVGLIGYSNGATIRNVGLTNVNVTAKNLSGTLVGYAHNNTTISNTYSSGTITGNGTWGNIGGLVGLIETNSAISDSYSTVHVTSNGHFVGGLIGYVGGFSGAVTITNTYAAGSVSGNSYVGGLVGDANTNSTISNSFWNTETSGQTYSSGGTGLTTAQMQNPFTFIDAGWDFASVWGKSNNTNTPENSGYMMLHGVGVSGELYDDYARLSNTNTSKTYGDANPSLTGITLDGIGTGNVSIDWNSDIATTTDAGIYTYSSNVLNVSSSSDNGVYVDYGTGKLTIGKASISAITGISVNNKVYDGTTNTTLNAAAASFNGMIVGDTLTVASGTGTFSDKNAGNGKTVTITDLTLGGADAGNYTLVDNTASTTANIDKATIAAVTGIAAADKIYDGTTAATLDNSGAGFSGMVNGDALTVATATGAFSDKNAASGKTVSITGLTLGGTDAGNYTLADNTASTTADINKATIAKITGITAADKTYDGTTDATLDSSGAGFSGMVSGDALTVATATGAFSDKNAASGKAVSITGLTLGGTDAGNYTLVDNTASTTANIDKATITAVTGIAAADKIYDGTINATLDNAGAGFTGIVSGDTLTVATATGAFSDKNAGNGKTVNITGLTLGGTDAGNYTLADNTATTTADINKATIAKITGITAEDKTYDGTTAATLDNSGAGFSGMVNGDALTVATATGAFGDKNAASGKAVSITGLTLGGTDAGNYTLADNTASTTADIDKATIANITGITAEDKTYDGTTAATLDKSGASFSGMVSGDALTVATAIGAFSDKNAASGKTVSITGLTLGGTDAGNYTLADNTATTTADIDKATIANITGITAEDKTYDGTTAATLDKSGAGFSGMVSGDALTVATAIGAFSDKNAASGKTVSITGLTLGGTDAGNYTLADNTATTTADINKATIAKITGITAKDKTYDGTATATLDKSGASFSGMVNGDALTVATATGVFGDKNAASDKTVNIADLTLGGTDAGNYTLADNTAITTADINKTALNITAEDVTKTYDGLAFSGGNGVTYDGFITGEDASVLVGSLIYSGTSQGAVDPGSYTLAASGFTSNNYNIAFSDGTLTVKQPVQAPGDEAVKLTLQHVPDPVKPSPSGNTGGGTVLQPGDAENTDQDNDNPSPTLNSSPGSTAGNQKIYVVAGGIRLPDDTLNDGDETQ